MQRVPCRMSEKRFLVKREGAHGAIIKDLKTGRTIAEFPADPDQPGAARYFADRAASYYDELAQRHETIKAKRKW